MKIYIRERGGRRFTIPIPMGLVRLGLGFGKLGVKISNKYVDEETRRYLNMIDFTILSKCIRDLEEYRGLTIIEVKSHSGDEVTIKL